METIFPEEVGKFLPFSPNSNSYRPSFEDTRDNNHGSSKLTLKERVTQRFHDLKNPLTAVSIGSEVVKGLDPSFSYDCDVAKAKTEDILDLINSYVKNDTISTGGDSKEIKGIVNELDNLEIFRTVDNSEGMEWVARKLYSVFNSYWGNANKSPLDCLRDSYSTFSGMVKQLDHDNNNSENGYTLFTLLADNIRGKYSAHPGLKVIEEISPDLKIHPFNVEDISAIVDNFASNGAGAMNYRGNLYLSASVREDNIHIEFKDEGKGMSQALVSKLENSEDRITYDKQGGSGFGLDLVKKLVHRYDGRLSISSEEGSGTTMGIEIPISGLYNHAPRA